MFHPYSVFVHVQNMGKFQMFEIFLTMLYQFMVAKYFHKFYIFQKLYFKEIDVLTFLTVSSSLGLPIVCKFEEWKRFAQFLVGEPTLPKLHMVLSLIGSVSLYKKKNLNII